MAAELVVAVVDDDHRVLESLESLLESAGYTVRLFSSADELFNGGGFAGIDCLISDIGMPVIDGFELKRLANVARPEMPVILITGRHEIASRYRGDAKTADDLFEKPFDGGLLLQAISNRLSSPRPG